MLDTVVGGVSLLLVNVLLSGEDGPSSKSSPTVGAESLPIGRPDWLSASISAEQELESDATVVAADACPVALIPEGDASSTRVSESERAQLKFTGKLVKRWPTIERYTLTHAINYQRGTLITDHSITD
jgi:hypothetical protein